MKNILHKCEICNLIYKKQKWAKRCLEWCIKNENWNLEITKHSIR